MSDDYICIIPKDPRYVPASSAELEAVMRELMPNAEEIEVETDPGIQFRDCGGNFETVNCPDCRAELAIEDWQEMMDADFIDQDHGFRLKEYALPCCGQAHFLNDLDYHFTQGFSRYMISAMNPNKGTLSAAEAQRLERAMGCAVTIIYRHL